MNSDASSPPSNGQTSPLPNGPTALVQSGRHVAEGNGDQNSAGGWQDPEPDDRGLGEYFGILYRRRWIAGTMFVLVLTLAIVRNFMAVPVYEATARVLVDPERLNLVQIEDVVSQVRSIDAEMAILRSRWLAKETSVALGLLPTSAANRSAEPSPPTTGGETLLAGGHIMAGPPSSTRDWWSALLIEFPHWWSQLKSAAHRVVGWEAPQRVAPAIVANDSLVGESPVEAQQINAFLSGLAVSPSNGLFDITYRSTDPVQAARFANAHARTYIEQNQETRVAAVQEATDWLRERLAEQKQKLDASEKAVIEFQERNGLIAAPEASSMAAARLNELSASITRAQTTRLEKDALYNRALRLRGNPDELDRLPPMMANGMLQTLRGELDRLQVDRARLAKSLREAHPDMIRLQESLAVTQGKLDVERSRVLESMREEVATARAAEVGLTGELEKLKEEAAAQNRGSVQLAILMREAQTNREIYDMLTQRARETGVAAEISPSRTRILDAALVPTAPINPNKLRALVQAALLGLVMAFAVALAFERLDNRIKLPDEIPRRLGIPFIGLIPEIRHKDRHALLATNAVAPQFTEELRRIRTNVLFSVPGDARRSVAITSTGPSEGKTVVACNLAITLAQAGQRVLLIDADLRRPAVHGRFHLKQEPGLTNVLVGDAVLSDALRRIPLNGLWILPAGRRPPNPSELLGSVHFTKLLASVSERFDWIIIDTTPVIPVTDACVFAHHLSGVLFLIGADKTSRHAAKRAVEQLQQAHGKVIGGVLSRVEVERHGYYFGAYRYPYTRRYGYYYSEPPAASNA